MQGWIATARHGGTAKRLKQKGNLFRKNLQLIGVRLKSDLDHRSKESIP